MFNIVSVKVLSADYISVACMDSKGNRVEISSTLFPNFEFKEGQKLTLRIEEQ